MDKKKRPSDPAVIDCTELPHFHVTLEAASKQRPPTNRNTDAQRSSYA